MKQIVLFSSILLLLLIACNDTPPAPITLSPTPTPVVPAVAPSATASLYPLPTAAPGSSPTPRPTATVRPSPMPTTPVFYDAHTGRFLDAVTDGDFILATVDPSKLQREGTYELYAGNRLVGTRVGRPAEGVPQVCGGAGPALAGERAKTWSLAVAGAPWELAPRPPVPTFFDRVRREALVERIHWFGVDLDPERVQITQAQLVDLEGDGTGEVVVAANRLTGEGRTPAVAAGDYALVAVLGADNRVEPVVLDLYREADPEAYPARYRVASILDLNGDGRQELVVAATHADMASTTVYELREGAYRPLFAAECLPLARISAFAVEPEATLPGGTLSVAWEATGRAAQLCFHERYTRRNRGGAAFCEDVALSGSWRQALPAEIRNGVNVVLTVNPNLNRLRREMLVDLSCPDDWWFMEDPPDSCPEDAPVTSPGLAQRFEGGQMVWVYATDTVYVFPDDHIYWEVSGPLSPLDQPVPTIEAQPPGLTVPAGRFGRLWRGDARLHDQLGWALGPAVAFDTAWQEEAYSSRIFFRAMDEILVLHEHRWMVWR